MADPPSASNKQHADLRPYQRQSLDGEKVTKLQERNFNYETMNYRIPLNRLREAIV